GGSKDTNLVDGRPESTKRTRCARSRPSPSWIRLSDKRLNETSRVARHVDIDPAKSAAEGIGHLIQSGLVDGIDGSNQPPVRAWRELVCLCRGLAFWQDHILRAILILDVQPVGQSGLLATQDSKERTDHLID